jgi:hypothetical protein
VPSGYCEGKEAVLQGKEIRVRQPYQAHAECFITLILRLTWSLSCAMSTLLIIMIASMPAHANSSLQSAVSEMRQFVGRFERPRTAEPCISRPHLISGPFSSSSPGIPQLRSKRITQSDCEQCHPNMSVASKAVQSCAWQRQDLAQPAALTSP